MSSEGRDRQSLERQSLDSQSFESRSFERLGRRLAGALNEHHLSDAQRLAQRARLIGWAAQPPTSLWQRLLRVWTGTSPVRGGARQLRAAWLAGAASAFAALALWLFWDARPTGEVATATHEVAPAAELVSPGSTTEVPALNSVLTAQHAGEAIRDGAWIAASDELGRIAFSDRSSIELLPGARARIVALDERGLRMSLESGHLEASITPGSGYQWTIQAGPYQVQVLGTVFSVDWSAEAHELTVEVRRGRVRVNEPEFADRGERILVAGDRLTVRADREAVPVIAAPAPPQENGRATDPSPAKPRSPDAAPRSSQEQSAIEQPSAETSVKSPSAPALPEVAEWKTLAQSGRYAEALTAARRVGFDSIVASASASDLLLLADSARLSGSSQVAKDTLLSLRERYPNHPNAVVAAFSLGRLSSDVHRDDQSAVKWFRAYLKSAPNGALAEGARGRLLMAYRRLGQSAAAQKAAQDYLAHHPSGRHANLARSLLDD